MNVRPAVRFFEGITGKSRLQILIFHRVLAQQDQMFPSVPDAARFRQLLRMLKAMYRILPLGEALSRLRAGRLPAGSVAITFDDGYEDNFSVALPILREESAPATIFVATRFLDGGRMFNDTVWEAFRNTACDGVELNFLGLGTLELTSWAQKRSAAAKVIDAIKYLEIDEREQVAQRVGELLKVQLRNDLMMTSEAVSQLPDDIITVGAHTHSHPILTRLPPEQARRDIMEGRKRLEYIRGKPIDLFAYPNGKPGHDYDRTHVDMMRDMGFQAAVTTAPGSHTGEGDFLQVPRFTPWRNDFPRFGMMMLGNSLALKPVVA